MRAFNAFEPVELGGEEYTLAIDISVIDKLEDEFDCSFDQLMEKIGGGRIRMGKMARLVKGLLTREHPDLSLDEVGTLLFSHGEAVSGALERLFEKAWPDQVAGTKGPNPRKARRGTGASSLSNGARKVSRQASSGSRPLELSS
jgi:hypothetical protein